MAKVDIDISIEATNIGVHEKLKSQLPLSSAQLAIYATNGSGKTCLSRAFRLYSKSITGHVGKDDSSDTLHFDHSSGAFRFGVRQSGNNEEFGFELQLDASSGTTVSQKSKYLFHVFNRDYVTENVERHNFAPDGSIDGIILGKENIDVSKEEATLSELNDERKKLFAEFERVVSEVREELTKVGVSRNLSEFKHISTNSLINGHQPQDAVEDYGVLKSQFEKLNQMPEELADATNFDAVPNDEIVDGIESILTIEHARTNLAEEFKAKIVGKVDFITIGATISDGKNCPYCEQPLTPPALDIIDKYNQFLGDEEARIIGSIRGYSNDIDQLQADCNEMHRQHLQGKIAAEKIQEFLPSTRGFVFNDLSDPVLLAPSFSVLADSLAKKEADISKSFGKECEVALSSISSFLENARACKSANQIVLDKINSKKNKIAPEKLELKKKLCLAKLEAVRVTSKSMLEQWTTLSKVISELEQDIKNKLHKNKKERKEEVVRTLKETLYQFFGNKFSFDDQKFCLTLREKRLAKNAHNVLSEGEKSIVAFCHYLASTHCMVNDDDDYKNLFFVIDDPISSMDFHFVYAIGQCIKNLAKQFALKYTRFIILTHNLEFISYLHRNRIANNIFVLEPSGIRRLERGAMLPYEAHLTDIWGVSEGSMEPSHTTPNSIRHVLEVIGTWLAPRKGLEKFCEEVESFQSSAYLWQLIQDQSHGTPRTELTHTPETVREACSLVIAFMKEKGLGGQLDAGDDTDVKH